MRHGFKLAWRMHWNVHRCGPWRGAAPTAVHKRSPRPRLSILAAENPMGFCLAGTNKPGYSSIFVMPASLFTATVFSEAMWQRAWASSDRK